jgi:polygalacturonase
MAVVDVIYDDDNLTIFGPPDVIDLSVDIGAQGNAGTVQVGTVTTVPYGTSASVYNVGSLTNSILNFVIPQGQTGSQGAQGPAGDTVPISTEQVQDATVPLFNHAYHTGFTVTYDDDNNRLLFQSDDVLTTEEVQDVVAGLFAAGSHVGASVSYNDAGNALSIGVTGINYDNVSINTYANEGALPSASSNTGKWAYVSGTGSMYYSHNSAWIKIINYTQEQVQDEIADVLNGSHTGITTSYNDSTGRIDIDNTGLLSLVGNSNQIGVDVLDGAGYVYLPANIITPGSLNVSGSATVNGDLRVNGSLYTVGDLVNLNAVNLLVADNIITLNSTASAVPVLDAGLEVERGSSTNVSIKWNEGSDKWQFTNDGVTYQDLGGSSASVNQKATNFYDIVRDFGASSGAADSFSEIQNALNAANSAGGGTVYIPNGTWNVMSTLNIFSNTTILCSEGAKLYKYHTLNFLANGSYGASYSGYNGQSNIRVIGGTWDCRGASYPSSPSMGLSFGHGQNILIQGVTIKNVAGYHAIEVNACKNVVIRDSQFLGFVDTGSRGYSEAIQIDLAKGSAYFGYFGAYDNTSCLNVTIDSCYFGASGDSGTTAWGTGIGSHSYTSTYFHKYTKITNNTFEGLGEYAIRLDVAHSDSIISNNIIKNCYAGIGAGFDTNDRVTSGQQCKNIIITSNQIDGPSTGHHGVYILNYDGVTVNSNHIKNIAIDGIALTTVVDATVSDNRIENIGNDGIDIRTNSSAIMVSNNIIKDVSQTTNNTHRFIYVSDSTTNTSIISNRGFKENTNVAQYGIQITNTCSGMRAFGNFVGTAATTAYQDNSGASTTTTNG